MKISGIKKAAFQKIKDMLLRVSQNPAVAAGGGIGVFVAIGPVTPVISDEAKACCNNQ